MEVLAIIAILLLAMVFILNQAVNEVYNRAILLKSRGKKLNADKKLILSPEQKKNDLYVSAHEWFSQASKLQLYALSHDGLKLCGILIKNNASNRACLVIPGWTDKKEYMYAESKLFYDLGYTVLIPDQRCHGMSEGEYVSFGVNEKLDMLKWLEYLNSNAYEDIVVFGRSMGAATAMLTACFSKETHVCCAIEDSGYTSLYEQLSSRIFLAAPWLSQSISRFFMSLVSKKIKKEAGFNIEEASPIKYLPKCKLPMLFIHGKADAVVPFDMMKDLYEAHAGEKQFLEVEGAKHVSSLLVDTANYRNTVIAFLKKYGNLSEVENV